MRNKSFTHLKENQSIHYDQNQLSTINFHLPNRSNINPLNHQYNQYEKRHKKVNHQQSINDFDKTPEKFTKRSHINSYNEVDDYSAFNQRSNTQNLISFSGNDDKKYKAKQQYIQSKLLNISSYQHKIQSLLEIVNKSPFSGKKQNQNWKKCQNNQLKRPNSKHNEKYNNIKKCSEIKQKPSKISVQTKQNHLNCFAKQNNQLSIKKHKRQLSKEQEEYTRKKSKEYMKSIQKQVKQITQTVSLLNQKINKNSKFVVKKQINFDDLENQEDFSLYKRREHFSKYYKGQQSKKKNHQVSCFQFDHYDHSTNKKNSKPIQYTYWQQQKLKKKIKQKERQKEINTPTKRKQYEYQKDQINAQVLLTPSSSKKAGQIYKQDHSEKSKQFY